MASKPIALPENRKTLKQTTLFCTKHGFSKRAWVECGFSIQKPCFPTAHPCKPRIHPVQTPFLSRANPVFLGSGLKTRFCLGKPGFGTLVLFFKGFRGVGIAMMSGIVADLRPVEKGCALRSKRLAVSMLKFLRLRRKLPKTCLSLCFDTGRLQQDIARCA